MRPNRFLVTGLVVALLMVPIPPAAWAANAPSPGQSEASPSAVLAWLGQLLRAIGTWSPLAWGSPRPLSADVWEPSPLRFSLRPADERSGTHPHWLDFPTQPMGGGGMDPNG